MSGAAKGNAIEVGTITTSTDDGDKFEYKYAMLVEFQSLDELKKALETGHIECTVLGAAP